ncbi:hypothetical protein A2318_03505 [Candidatus Uhrbacteria bacterium RIFOXYB2_FULL_45_11]|uniref:O-antigen ligase-related domain-containing protein n=1 Tax=Candidatus Uhrbacteria bacterium RIFOXYB2_FULL_45_11 TaxID=1802421 RepID=A0A1F7W3Q1_9BACT|nr:MAG: hypothetical protein A2318_03505 [Candidatus Uhrbacteria bacterium RIFOXYB2_FULL_45_11]
MQLFSSLPQKFFPTALLLVLLTPLIYFPWIYRPAQISKVLFFVCFIGVFFLFALAWFQIKKMLPRFSHPVLLSYGGYVLFVVISSLFGFDLVNSFLGNDQRVGGIIVLAITWLAAALFVGFFDKLFWKHAVSFFIFTGVLIASYAILEAFRLVPDLGLKWPRTSSLMGNPIYLAAYLIFPFTLACTKIWTQQKLSRNHCIAAGIIFLGIATTRSRGVFLGLIIGGLLGMFWYFLQKVHWKKMFLFSSIILVALVSCFLLARAIIPETSNLSRFVRFNDQSSSSRLEFWKIAFVGALEHPVLGVGYENFYAVSEKHYSPALYAAEGSYSDKPHNAFVEVLISSGVIGLILYCVVLLCVLRSIIRAKKKHKIHGVEESILLGGFIAYSVQNFFAFDTIGTFFSFAFFIAYVTHLDSDFDQKIDVTFLRSKRMRSVLLSVFSVLIVWFCVQYVFPTYTYFSTLANADREANVVKRFALLKSINQDAFIYDYNPLGKSFHSTGKMIYNKDGATQMAKEYVQSALETYDVLLNIHPKRGEFWYQRADMGLMKAFMSKSPIDEATKIAVEKAVGFTPTRTEPYLVKATQLELEGKIPEAIDMLEEILLKIPDSSKLLWTLSVLYGKQGNDAKFAEFGYKAIDSGLKVAGVQSILDLVNYFAAQREYKKVIRLYQQAIVMFPDEVQLYANLAAAYAADGQIEKAIEAAQKLKQLKPENAAGVNEFIESLRRIE